MRGWQGKIRRLGEEREGLAEPFGKDGGATTIIVTLGSPFVSFIERFLPS